MSGPSSRKVSGSSSRSRGPSPNTTKEVCRTIYFVSTNAMLTISLQHLNSSGSTAPSNISASNPSGLNTLHNKWKVRRTISSINW
jgi:hypothetical protein